MKTSAILQLAAAALISGSARASILTYDFTGPSAMPLDITTDQALVQIFAWGGAIGNPAA